MVTEDEIKALLAEVIPSDRAAQATLPLALLVESGTNHGEDTVRTSLMRLEEEFELAADALDEVWAYIGLSRGWPS